MGAETGIQWCDHTFNPWRGCTKVSPGCAQCYAETMSHRNPSVLGEWGPNGKRVVAADSYWRQPIKWNRAAMDADEQRRVFCASLADIWEDRDELIGPRNRLFETMAQTDYLDWLLLTKRPENILRLWPKAFLPADHEAWDGRIWLGTSVEDQERADERIPELLATPAAVRFLSVEPLLGPVDFARVSGAPGRGIDWVIVGGESGPDARPCDIQWISSIVLQCKAAGTSVFVKQLGSNPVSCSFPGEPTPLPGKLRDKKGGDIGEFPEYLRIREFPK